MKGFAVAGMLLCGFIVSGCQSGPGARWLAELGFDVQSRSMMSPLERSLACVNETEQRSTALFNQAFSTMTSEVERGIPNSDWSGLVCLSFSEQVNPDQLEKTVALLRKITQAETLTTEREILQGLIRLLEQRKMLVQQHRTEGAQWQRQLAVQAEQSERQLEAFRAQAKRDYEQLTEQRERIRELEQQVRKLNEVELLLQTDPNAPR